MRVPSSLNRAALVAVAGTMAVTGVAGVANAAAKAPHKSNKASSQMAALEKTLASLQSKASHGTVSETGSSLFYPLFSTWAQSYKGASIQTASTGSGAGQSGAENGTVDIGASDAYLPTSVLSQTGSSAVLNIPEVISAQQIDYNLPGISAKTHIKLNAKVLAGMYDGSITKWNDSAITSINPGLKLPSTKIVPIHRSDSSGDTFLFSGYLAAGDPSSFAAQQGGANTSVNWPNVSGALAAKGNTGMLATCRTTPGCIAYIGISYLRSAVKQGLGYAKLQNGKGNYVLLSPKNIALEVASFKHIPANGAVSLVYSKSAKYGYPIVNFEYAIVKKNQPSSAKANDVKALLAWGADPTKGSATKFLAPVNFQPLPQNALAVATKLIQSIG